MMKRTAVLLMLLCLLLCTTGCSGPQTPSMEPKLSQMKAICELSTMECYYHNVAKFEQKNAETILWWQKDKHFWIEYSGVVSIGIDASLVTLEVSGTQVTITMPQARVLGCRVDSSSLSEGSFIVDQNSAAISASDEIAAFDEAQSRLAETAANDKALLASAQQRAQSLLEEYIRNIGSAIGTEYSITWVYLDADGNALPA